MLVLLGNSNSCTRNTFILLIVVVFLLTPRNFESKLQPESHRTPCFIYAFGNFCFHCMRMEHILEKFFEELETVGERICSDYSCNYYACMQMHIHACTHTHTHTHTPLLHNWGKDAYTHTHTHTHTHTYCALSNNHLKKIYVYFFLKFYVCVMFGIFISIYFYMFSFLFSSDAVTNANSKSFECTCAFSVFTLQSSFNLFFSVFTLQSSFRFADTHSCTQIQKYTCSCIHVHVRMHRNMQACMSTHRETCVCVQAYTFNSPSSSICNISIQD